MNNIPDLQNKPFAIKQLGAQAKIYSTAKTLFAIQLSLNVLLVIFVALAALAFDKQWFGLPKYDLAPYVGVLGMCLTLLDILILNPMISSLRGKAASIQQQFDSAVLNIPWNEIAFGRRPNNEDVELWAKRNQKLIASGKYDNWYRVEVRELPFEVARLLCQRANCWWDMELRWRYNVIVGIVGVVLFAILLGVSLGLDVTSTNFFGLVVAPFLPFLATAPKLILDNRDAIIRLETMKSIVDDTWNRSLQPIYDIDELTSCARDIQGGIFNNRSQNPLIFDWLANRLRPRNEDLQRSTIEQYVAEFKSAHPHLYP